MAKSDDTAAATEATPEPKFAYRVREGFYLHILPADIESVGGEVFEGGETVSLTAAEAAFYAAQIELADPAMIEAALTAEAARDAEIKANAEAA